MNIVKGTHGNSGKWERRDRRFLGLLKRASMAEVEEIVDPIGVDTNKTIVIWIGTWIGMSSRGGGVVGAGVTSIFGLNLGHSNPIRSWVLGFTYLMTTVTTTITTSASSSLSFHSLSLFFVYLYNVFPSVPGKLYNLRICGNSAIPLLFFFL